MNSGRSVPYLALAGGFIAVMVTFYYMEVLSYAAGVDSGAAIILNAYNVTPTNTILTSLVKVSSLLLAVHITYIMLPFALITFAIGVLWLFSKARTRLVGGAEVFSAFAFMLLSIILNLDFSFGALQVASLYIAGGLTLLAGLLAILENSGKTHHRASSPIEINPNRPYSNMLVIADRLISRMEGEVSILDMHFDPKAMENLVRLAGRNAGSIDRMRLLTKADRLGKDFEKSYMDFVEEMRNLKIEFELRVMNPEDAAQQHERLIMDSKSAYKIPPLNIINKKSEHIVSIDHARARSRFDFLWNRGTKYETVMRQGTQ